MQFTSLQLQGARLPSAAPFSLCFQRLVFGPRVTAHLAVGSLSFCGQRSGRDSSGSRDIETRESVNVTRSPVFTGEQLPLEEGADRQNASLYSETEKTVGLDTKTNLGPLEQTVSVDQCKHARYATEPAAPFPVIRRS